MVSTNRGRIKARALHPVLGACEVCATRPAVERHHIDGDTSNNRRANVLLVCRGCHMRLDGRLEASSRRISKVAVTHCPAGHPYDQGNTYLNGKGHRICRACNRERQRRLRGRFA